MKVRDWKRRRFNVNFIMVRNESGLTYGLLGKEDPRPCKGGNTNICVAEGCFDGECLNQIKEK